MEKYLITMAVDRSIGAALPASGFTTVRERDLCVGFGVVPSAHTTGVPFRTRSALE